MAAAGIMARFLGAVKIGRLYLSHRKALTAGTTQSVAGATLLDRVINNVTTVGTTGDAVKLPPIVESAFLIVSNAGANSMTIYSNEGASVSINGTSGATGVALASGSTAFFVATDATHWKGILAAGPSAGSFTTLAASSTLAVTGAATLSSTLAVTGASTLAAVSATNIVASGYVEKSVGNALTAAGSTRTDALQLAKQVNNVTVAATGTGVILPVGVIGMEIDIFARSFAAAAIQVYASASETIDTVAGSTGVVLTKTKACRYTFVAANTWVSAQLGVISA
jgi:fibronectin-binding autotransporter adhesin